MRIADVRAPRHVDECGCPKIHFEYGVQGVALSLEIIFVKLPYFGEACVICRRTNVRIFHAIPSAGAIGNRQFMEKKSEIKNGKEKFARFEQSSIFRVN